MVQYEPTVSPTSRSDIGQSIVSTSAVSETDQAENLYLLPGTPKADRKSWGAVGMGQGSQLKHCVPSGSVNCAAQVNAWQLYSHSLSS
jgi:hypothetical protein